LSDVFAGPAVTGEFQPGFTAWKKSTPFAFTTVLLELKGSTPEVEALAAAAPPSTRAATDTATAAKLLNILFLFL
jgi:hypothetical protein